jgi:hypothetical protein
MTYSCAMVWRKANQQWVNLFKASPYIFLLFERTVFTPSVFKERGRYENCSNERNFRGRDKNSSHPTDS